MRTARLIPQRPSIVAACMAIAAGVGCGKSGCCEDEAANKGDGGPSKTARTLPERLPPGPGLTFRLSPGRGSDDEAKRPRATRGRALGPAQTKALLARLKPIAKKRGDRESFAFRARSLPPPRTGKTIEAPFPPPSRPEVGPAAHEAAGPLKVVRGAPRGEVDRLAPNLSVTFSQPMVPVTSHAETTAKGVPVKVTPEVEGVWRWIGTKTLLFEPKPRFAMATQYRVEVSSEARSTRGGTLAKPHSWSFTTPAPRLMSYAPMGRRVSREPLIFMAFDQRVDAEALRARVRLQLSSDKKKKIALKPAAEKRIAEEEQLSRRIKAAKPGSWVAFTASSPLEPDASYRVVIPAGTPSAEGPRKTKKDQSFTFRTYPPLTVKRHACVGYYRCTPLSSLWITFSNRLAEGQEERLEKLLEVKPKIPGMSLRVSYRQLTIRGRLAGRTRYRVIVPSSLHDVHDQALGVPRTIVFPVGPAKPRIFSDNHRMRVLDPAGARSYRVRSINHRRLDVLLYRVDPSDWPSYLRFRAALRSRKPQPPPGKLSVRRRLRVQGPEDQLATSAIGLKKALGGSGHGQVVALIKQTPWPSKPYKRQFAISWLQSTKLGLDAFVDPGRLLAWVTRLDDGRPVSGAEVTLLPDGISGRSDDSGLVSLQLPDSRDPRGERVLVAKKGDDVAMLPGSRYRGWHKREVPGDALRWFVFDDRKLYKPKQTVRLKGWVRVVDMGPTGEVRLIGNKLERVRYQVFEPRGNRIARGTAAVDELGGFDFSFKLSDRVNLGRARVELTAPGVEATNTTHHHRFRIQEFRRPEFEVKATGDEGPHLIGGHAETQVSARYFSGAPLPNAQLTWRVRATPGHFYPPGREKFRFGGIRPRWWQEEDPERQWKTQSDSFSGYTDSRGKHRLRIDFDSVRPPRPVSIRASVTVRDINRRAWTSHTQLLVHPAAHYVGLRSERSFVKRGEPLEIEAIVADLEGDLVAGTKIEMRARRVVGRYVKGSWKQHGVDPQTCSVNSKRTPVVCRFETKKGGQYLIEATITDAKGRKNQTLIPSWVSGGQHKPERRVTRQRVKLLSDKKRYRPGDTAEVLVQSPFVRGEGLLTIRRSGLLAHRRFSVRDGSAVVTVPIKASHYPSLRIQVDIVGSAPRVDEQGKRVEGVAARPALASGSLSLSVPPLDRALVLDVKPAKKALSPGAKTAIQVTVRRPGGDPDDEKARGAPVAGAQVAVVVVDESILALTGYRIRDPLRTFYPYRSSLVRDHHQRTMVQLDDPLALLEQVRQAVDKAPSREREESPADDTAGASTGASRGIGGLGLRGRGRGGGGAGYGTIGDVTKKTRARRRAPATAAPAKLATLALAKPAPREPATPIAVRKDFRALALFAPATRTDAQGRAVVALKLPDSLTRYRVMAVAVADAKYYGKGEATITARQPLMVRPSPPRFLNFGDRFDLPLVLQNRTDEPLDVKVAVRASNLALTQGAGRALTVPAKDRLELRFAAKAVDPGTARVQIGISAGAFADAAELSFPVWTPATSEAFATYGEIDQGSIVQSVRVPNDVVESFGGLEITTSSTQLQALTDAFLYLVRYRFECSEQLSSRILAVAALRDVLKAFDAPGLVPEPKILASVTRDLRRLRGMQNPGGGFPWWRRGRRSWPFLSNHVTHALVRAKAKGFSVNPRMLSRALARLRTIESIIPHWYSKSSRQAVIAYSLYVRALAGQRDEAKARRVLRWALARKKVPMEIVAWLYPVFSRGGADAKKVEALLNNRVGETAATAHFVTSYTDGAHVLLHSSRRVDAVLLEGLIAQQPKSDLIVKLVRGLLAHRKRGRWSNTQENAWVLLALDRYFEVFEKLTPNFVARAWLGERFAGQHAYRGRTTERHMIRVPMKLLAESGKEPKLALQKKGAGRLYYRIGMRYAPADLELPAASHGFTVLRSYEGVDSDKDVRRDKDGTWRVKSGTRVRVRLRMVAPGRRYHVALVDPLPAGLEPINGALRGAETTQGSPRLSRLGGLRSFGRIGHSLGRLRGRIGGLHFGRYGRWRAHWWEHQNLRDERAEAFTSLLRAGVHSYSYLARATTPGQFVVPPPKAEEMYHPETFGRGPGDRLIVE